MESDFKVSAGQKTAIPSKPYPGHVLPHARISGPRAELAVSWRRRLKATCPNSPPPRPQGTNPSQTAANSRRRTLPRRRPISDASSLTAHGSFARLGEDPVRVRIIGRPHDVV